MKTVDIDKDGDKDYIFLLGGMLYVKQGHANTPLKISDTVSRLKTLPGKGKNATEYPTVPNHFNEELSTPKELHVTFAEAAPNVTGYRIEFFDRYMEWDMVSMGKSTQPIQTIDLFADPTLAEDSSNSLSSGKVARSFDSGYSDAGVVINSPKIQVLTGAIDISLSPNRSIYTGNEPVKIWYRT